MLPDGSRDLEQPLELGLAAAKLSFQLSPLQCGTQRPGGNPEGLELPFRPDSVLNAVVEPEEPPPLPPHPNGDDGDGPDVLGLQEGPLLGGKSRTSPWTGSPRANASAQRE